MVEVLQNLIVLHEADLIRGLEGVLSSNVIGRNIVKHRPSYSIARKIVPNVLMKRSGEIYTDGIGKIQNYKTVLVANMVDSIERKSETVLVHGLMASIPSVGQNSMPN